MSARAQGDHCSGANRAMSARARGDHRGGDNSAMSARAKSWIGRGEAAWPGEAGIGRGAPPERSEGGGSVR